jgi:DNA-nicking Smr family endonuclease
VGHDPESLDDEEDPPPAVDLHGLRPDDALRRAAREIHACRVRRMNRLKIITGKGWGNLLQQPVLRPKVEQWLNGPEGRRAGVLGFVVADDGGSLIVEIRCDGHSKEWRQRDPDG